jgi:hypothetical protein
MPKTTQLLVSCFSTFQHLPNQKERQLKKRLYLIMMLLAMVHAGCATTNPVLAFKEREIGQTLTRQSFERIEPLLRNIHPDQTMDSTGLAWPVHEIKSGNRLVGLVASADGWAGGLSGNITGAFSKLGEPVGLEKGQLYGQHIYGYIIQPSFFIPRYALQTRATIIDEKEYETLRKSQAKGIGWTFTPGGGKKKIFFKDLKVLQVKELYKPEEAPGTLKKGESVSPSEASSFFSKERYERAAIKIGALSPGLDIFSVIKSLNGSFVAQYGGVSFILFMDGLLKYTGENIISKPTPDGIYIVWPFGYVEDGKEVPKMAVIFRNGQLQKVVPYSSKQAIMDQLN